MSTDDDLRRPPFRERTPNTVPIALPSGPDLPARYRAAFDASAPTINIGEASVTVLLLREHMTLLDQKRQVDNERKQPPKPPGERRVCAYTRRFVTATLPRPSVVLYVPDTDVDTLNWLRERLAVKKE